MDNETRGTRRTRAVALALLLVFLGESTWVFGRMAVNRIVARLAVESRSREAVKCTGSTIPYDVLEVLTEFPQFRPETVFALIYVESGGNPNAVNGRCRGLMMVRIDHCKALQIEEEDLRIPRVNVWAGLTILAERQAKYPNAERDYICAYNCPDDLMKAHLEDGKRLPEETRIHWRRYQAEKKRYADLFSKGEWDER